MRFPKVQSTFGVTPYNPERDTDEKRRAIFEHYQSQMGAQPLPPETLPWNKPFPPGIEAQQAFDSMLQERVVDPLARAGYEGLGAGLASIPSAAHEMIVPQTEFDIAGTIIPLPGVAKAIKADKRAFPEITKAMRAEKKAKDVGEYSKAVEALRGDDPDLGAIKVSPDINVTPGMTRQNFEASQKKNAENLRMDTLFGDLKENPRSAKVSGVRGGLYGNSTGIDLVQQVLNLNEDIPGLKKLAIDRQIILKGRNPYEIRWEDREKLGLLKIEKEIAKIMKANQKQLKLPIGMDEQRTDFIPRWELEDRIRKKEYDKAEAKAKENAVADEANLKEQEILEKMSQNVDGEKPKKFESVDDLIKEFREFANIPQKPKIPLTSLQKGGWYDEIGGREGFEPQLENLKKLNPKAQQLHDAIDEYLKRESYRDPNIYRNDYVENAYDNIIDLIDKNLDRIKLPKPLSPGDQAIDRVLKAGQKEGKLSLPERSQLEKAMSESKKAIEAEENVEFHKERFKKIKELLGNVSTLKGKD